MGRHKWSRNAQYCVLALLVVVAALFIMIGVVSCIYFFHKDELTIGKFVVSSAMVLFGFVLAVIADKIEKNLESGKNDIHIG